MSNTIETAPSGDFEQIVSRHYEPLYRFALSLTRTEADACDLTQQTFYIWATRGHQLRDRSKVKSWLFTTLHREFLCIRRRAMRFPEVELSDANEDLPTISVEMVNTLDGAKVLEFLGQVQEPYRAALTLFYLEDYSYREIADILEIPLGTVRSRISRGMAQLQQSILMGAGSTAPRAMPLPDTIEPRSSNVNELPGPDGNGHDGRAVPCQRRKAWHGFNIASDRGVLPGNQTDAATGGLPGAQRQRGPLPGVDGPPDLSAAALLCLDQSLGS